MNCYISFNSRTKERGSWVEQSFTLFPATRYFFSYFFCLKRVPAKVFFSSSASLYVCFGAGPHLGRGSKTILDIPSRTYKNG